MNKKDSMRYVYPLCFGEEVGNCITHGVMAILILFSLPYYSVRAYLRGGTIETIGTAVFLICLLFMFAGSCLYHSMPHETTHKYVFRKLDHIMILLAIAGTYTPICLKLMNNWKKKLNHNASLTIEKFKKMVNIHGADHILFGSDSPWDDQKDAVDLIKECGFSEKDTDAILGKNAVTLLNL